MYMRCGFRIALLQGRLSSIDLEIITRTFETLTLCQPQLQQPGW